MKPIKTLTLFFAVALNVHALALQPSEETSAIDHLLEVNAQWKYHQTDAPDVSLTFQNDVDRISFHLHHVIRVLNQAEVHGFMEDAIEKRYKLLNELETYADNKVFPTNHYHSERRPYFIDNYGVHCAVGYLIKVSGHEDLAQRIRSEHNYDYVADIKTNGLNEWAVKHGFTLDELKWIQPGYQPKNNELRELENGPDGPVLGMEKDPLTGKVYCYGNFTLDNDKSCNDLAYIEGGEVKCLETPFTGEINDLSFVDGVLYVAGELDVNGETNTVAVLKGGNWSYFHAGPVDAIGQVACGMKGKAGNAVLLVTSSETSKKNEVWSIDLKSGKSTKQFETYGIILDAQFDSEMTWLAGDFDSVYSVSHGWQESHNFMTYSKDINEYGLYGGNLPDAIHKIKFVESDKSVYLVGKADGSDGSRACVVRYGESLIPVLRQRHFNVDDDPVTIYDLDVIDDRLTIAGDFKIYPNGVGIFGSGMAEVVHQDTFDFVYPLALLSGAAYGLEEDNNGDVFIGGSFTKNSANWKEFDVKYLARSLSFSNASDPLEINLSIYPNPASEVLNVEVDAQIKRYAIYDVMGQVVDSKLGDVQTISVKDFKEGMYFLQLETDAGFVTKKIIKSN